MRVLVAGGTGVLTGTWQPVFPTCREGYSAIVRGEGFELVDAAVERIERLNPRLSTVVTRMYDRAREAALGPIPDGPFTGVPFLLKDFLAEHAGVRLTEGTAFLDDYVSDQDRELVSRGRSRFRPAER